MARRNLGEILAGAAVLLVAAGFLGYAVAHSGRSSVAGYVLHASFDHIDGLNTGADVRLAGVKVGSVLGTRIDPKTYLANVTLNVQDGIRLPKDSSAEVTSEGLLHYSPPPYPIPCPASAVGDQCECRRHADNEGDSLSPAPC